MISDIFPTGWFGADLAEVSDGDTVAVFGCGPVGQFAITSAFIMGAGQVLAVDKDCGVMRRYPVPVSAPVNVARWLPYSRRSWLGECDGARVDRIRRLRDRTGVANLSRPHL
jgi:hypothetical protein